MRGFEGLSEGMLVLDKVFRKGKRKVRMLWSVSRLLASACWSNALFSGSWTTNSTQRGKRVCDLDGPYAL